LVFYINEQLWKNPSIIHFLNEHTNNLYNIPEPIEYLKLLKKLFSVNNITKYNLWSYFPKRDTDLYSEIERIEKYDDGDIRSKLIMIKHNENYLDRYKKITATKAAAKKHTSDVKNTITQAIKNYDKNEIAILENKNLIFDKLTQELINEEELVLFNISILKKANKVLYTFINKNNKKRYYLEPFQAKIYVSKETSILQNDYIEEINDDKFIEYIIPSYKNFSKIKYVLNDNYIKLLNDV
jgi:hypothetical protein